MRRLLKILFGIVVVFIIIGLAGLAVPPVRERVFWHADQWRIRLQYALRPPEKEIFIPQEQPRITPTSQYAGEETAPDPSATPLPTATSQPEVALDTPVPTPTSRVLPASVRLDGIKYFDQHGLWNYCAPANLAMALSFWGWNGDRTDVGEWVKPFEKDKNVMPYELADYVREQTQLSVIQRYGGTLETLKTLISSGFPVLIEKGAYMTDLSGKVSWMGHYAVVNGYDDAKGEFLTQDSYYEANYPIPYQELESQWRAFNFVFLVIYPPERENEVLELLGPLADEEQALRQALARASDELYRLDGIDQFFAWFNRGTSMVGLKDFLGASAAYDEAFGLYPSLPEDQRPWRMLWYQTGPYFAYYYTGRYADLEALATQTIESASEPYLEESFYWRAKAREALGDIEGAIEDLKTSLEYHPNFNPSVAALQNLGVTP